MIYPIHIYPYIFPSKKNTRKKNLGIKNREKIPRKKIPPRKIIPEHKFTREKKGKISPRIL